MLIKLNKKGNKMKTITITLNEEQERLLMNRIVRSTWKIPTTSIKYLRKDYKNPSDWTKQQIDYAQELDKKLDEENDQMEVVINQIKKQLEQKG